MKKLLLSTLILLLLCQVDAQKISNVNMRGARSFVNHNNDNEESLRPSNKQGITINVDNRNQTLNGLNKLETSKKIAENAKFENAATTKRKSKEALFTTGMNLINGNKNATRSAALKAKSVPYSAYILDSLVYYDLIPSSIVEYKVVYTYDSQHRVIQYIESELEDDGWEMYKMDIAYNNINQMSSMTAYIWNPNLTTWSLEEKAIYEYDSKGKNILQIYSDWNKTTNSWVNYSKYEMQFDSDGNETLSIWSDWNKTTNKWLYYSKSETNYDSNSNVILEADYVWNETRKDWEGSGEKKEFAYDNAGKLLLDATYRWNSNTNMWEYDTLYAYESDGNQVASLANDEGYKNDNIRNAAGFITQQITHEWSVDTNDWLKIRKYEYTYDANNNNTLYYRSNWNVDTNKWDLKVKNENSFDINNNMTLRLNYNWDVNSNNWIYNLKQEFTFDNKNNMLQFLVYTWNKATSTWTNDSKYVNTRDNLDNIIQQDVFSWNTTENSWDTYGKYVLSYENDYTTEIYSEYDNVKKTWTNVEKWEYVYDSNEILTYDAYYKWNTSYKKWEGIGYKREKVFDSAGRQTFEANYQWVFSADKWEGRDKYEKAFDDAGRQILDASYNWNSYTNDWTGSSKEEYAFDTMGRETMNASFSWDYLKNNWKGDYKRTTTFTNFTVIAANEELFEDLDVDNSVRYEWDEDSNDWIEGSKVQYYYSEINTALKNTTQNSLSLYPTLASNYVTLRASSELIGSTFSVHDILGHSVLKGTISNETTKWDVSQWEKGIYLLKLDSQNPTNLKIIKK